MRVRPRLLFLTMSSIALVGAASVAPLEKASFTVPLSGDGETNIAHPDGGTGDPDAKGSVQLTIDQSKRKICYDFAVTGLATPMMAHIHRGHPLQNGPTVVTLFTGMGGEMSDCVLWTNKQLGAIVANPSDYYVNVYTTEYPDGALRGQLPG